MTQYGQQGSRYQSRQHPRILHRITHEHTKKKRHIQVLYNLCNYKRHSCTHACADDAVEMNRAVPCGRLPVAVLLLTGERGNHSTESLQQGDDTSSAKQTLLFHLDGRGELCRG